VKPIRVSGFVLCETSGGWTAQYTVGGNLYAFNAATFEIYHRHGQWWTSVRSNRTLSAIAAACIRDGLVPVRRL
jgi:hypothetical protein